MSKHAQRVVMVNSQARQCVKRRGRWLEPKQAYRTKAAAELAINGDTNLRAYPCAQHGWHIGHHRD